MVVEHDMLIRATEGISYSFNIKTKICRQKNLKKLTVKFRMML